MAIVLLLPGACFPIHDKNSKPSQLLLNTPGYMKEISIAMLPHVYTVYQYGILSIPVACYRQNTQVRTRPGRVHRDHVHTGPAVIGNAILEYVHVYRYTGA